MTTKERVSLEDPEPGPRFAEASASVPTSIPITAAEIADAPSEDGDDTLSYFAKLAAED